jgi:lipoprotein-anchoring transpeptidase ErfK/SrfK
VLQGQGVRLSLQAQRLQQPQAGRDLFENCRNDPLQTGKFWGSGGVIPSLFCQVVFAPILGPSIHRLRSLVAACTAAALLLSSLSAGQQQLPGSEAAPTAPPPLPVSVAYRIEPQLRTAAELARRFTPAQLDVIEMLNRRDREHLIRAEPPIPGIVVPSEWVDDTLAYAPFPSVWPAVEASVKALVVHQPTQAFAAYESGRLVKWGPVSTGRKETPTPTGQFNLTWRARSRRSTDNQDWLLEWYFNFVNERGVSFHLFDLPGYPASHACVRLLRRDAEWLYRWGEQWTLDDTHRVVVTPGTPVLILGVYRYDGPTPWTSIESLAVPIQLP